MVKRSQYPRFALEAGVAIRIGGERGWQYLQRDFATELGVHGPIHFAHPAFAEFGGDLIVCDGLADHFLSPASQFTATVKGCVDIKPLATLSNKKRFPSAVTSYSNK